MARPLRPEFPGAIYHVTSRGNKRRAIYRNDADRLQFLKVLADTCGRMNWRCHAYCLMDNHYHLLIETPQGNLSRGMRQLNGIYTQGFNRHHRRAGPVFQGRYKAILIDRDAYLKELARYIVLNPVRAKSVKKASQWPWSSYRATAGKKPAPDWLTTDWLLGQFGQSRCTAQKAYERFVEAGKGQPSIWTHLKQQIYLGDETFIRNMQRKLEKYKDVSGRPKSLHPGKPKPLAHYARKAKEPQQAMATSYLSGGYSLSAIADYFGVHYSTVSRMVKKHEHND